MNLLYVVMVLMPVVVTPPGFLTTDMDRPGERITVLQQAESTPTPVPFAECQRKLAAYPDGTAICSVPAWLRAGVDR